MKILGLLLSLALTLPLYGEVFTLWPLKPNGATSEKSLINEIPALGKVLHTERMVVNGVDLSMVTRSSDADFATILEFLYRSFRPENLTLGSDSAKVAYKIGENQTERWLIVDGGLGKAVTIFQISAPATLPKATDWPGELPHLPIGANVGQIIHFPDRKAIYGSFSNGGSDTAMLLRNVVGELKSSGWIPLGNEAETSSGGRGEIFLHNNPRRIMWVNFGQNGTGVAYTRPY
ncbi:MAG: hypothetical protein LBM70_03485 [Victivallales bacterium]|jgi:hypothetical protein|nr:hypothetical protein [Victivallales bacterium]